MLSSLFSSLRRMPRGIIIVCIMCVRLVHVQVGIQGVIQDFMLGGEHFLGIENVCETDVGANHTLQGGLGACPPSPPESFEEKNSCPEIESGGFWQLADYPILVFKITAF